ncbi:LppP/LprE family lipoprotein [Antrihabitans spumae]|uniref:LppP/LprE family lipoprotein n=1 Tax=Antrihabitans spumae TaxID=3373370 RepID=A0ABW7KQW0_9NOCA
MRISTMARVCVPAAIVLAFATGCQSTDQEPTAVPGTTATVSASATAGTTAAEEPQSGAATATSEATTVAPKTDDISGSGLCLDPQAPGVVAALATLSGGPWVAEHSSDSAVGSCPELLWLSAAGGNSAGAPIHVLFFHEGSYLGTATSEPYAFTHVATSTSDSATVEYKWLAGDEPFCCPQGGPVAIDYVWDGTEVVMSTPLPDEVTKGR